MYIFSGWKMTLMKLSLRSSRRLSALLNHRSAVYLEEQVINAPEQRASPYGMGPPPAMQLGNYNTNTPEDDVELARWYRAERFARVSVTPGMIRGRKLLSIAGWAKHGVLWEFTDLPDGDHSFEHRFVAAVLKMVAVHRRDEIELLALRDRVDVRIANVFDHSLG